MVACSWLIWLSRDQINPDGVAYIELARHWAAGRFDLAVTSWWGPMLSWLLVPVVWLGGNEALAVKIIGAVCGAMTAVAAGRIASLLSGGDQTWSQTPRPRHQATGAVVREGEAGATTSNHAGTLTFAATLALALLMIAEPVTPDVLLTCVITWYFLFMLKWLLEGRTRDIVLAGLLGGVGFMTKSYALPFVIVHIILTAWMRRRRIRRELSQGASLRPALHALAMLAIVTLPWVATISRQANTLTIGCTGQYARRAFDPVALKNYPDLPIFDLQWPREGRLTCWENGLETQRAWPDWPVLCQQGVGRLSYSSFLNAQRTLDFLNAADRLGLMRISLVMLALAGVLRFVRGPKLWAILSVLGFSAGYLPLIVYDRYLWPAWPTQLAIVFAILLPARADRPVLGYEDRWRLFLPGVAKVAAVLLLLSLAWADMLMIHKWSGPDGEGAKYAYLRAVGREIALQGNMPVASNEWHQGLFGAFWGDRTYLGQIDGRNADAVAAELASYGPTCLIVFDDPALCDELSAGRSFFHRIELPEAPAAWSGEGPRIAAFVYVPCRPNAE